MEPLVVASNLRYRVTPTYVAQRVEVIIRQYVTDNRFAILLTCVDGDGYREPLLTATVNLPKQPIAAYDVALKNWSENEGIEAWLLQHDVIIEPVKGRFVSGYVSGRIYSLHPDVIAKIVIHRSKVHG